MTTKPHTGSNPRAYNATPNACPPNESTKPAMPLIDVAINEANEVIDTAIYSAPSKCREAVNELCGESWGVSLFDVAPLFTAFMDAVAQLSEIDGVDYPADVARGLLGQSVEQAKKSAQFPHMVDVRRFNPVCVLAGYMQANTALLIGIQKR